MLSITFSEKILKDCAIWHMQTSSLRSPHTLQTQMVEGDSGVTSASLNWYDVRVVGMIIY